MSPVQKLFDFRGRIRRRDYWIYSILVGLFSLGVTAIGVLGAGLELGDKNLALATNLLVAWPNLAIGVKRLHDRGRSGWFVLIFFVAPAVIFELVDRLAPAAPIALLMSVLAAVPALWGLVEMGFRDTVPGPNRFGQSPKSVEPPTQLDNPTLPGGGASA